jgi:hypothetical protein
MYVTCNLVNGCGFSLCVQLILLTIGEYESDLITITLLDIAELPVWAHICVHDASMHGPDGTSYVPTESFRLSNVYIIIILGHREVERPQFYLSHDATRAGLH